MSIFDGSSPRHGFPVLAGLPWTGDPAQAQRSALELLTSEENLAETLSAWLRDLSPDDAACAGMESRTTATHEKWFLGGGGFSEKAGRAYIVWLHDYFDPEKFRESSRFAASVHNHRYGFASRVISGGLSIAEFDIPAPGRSEPPRLARAFDVAEGGTMSVSPDDIHQITAVRANTRTLLVQGPAKYEHSTVYRIDGTREDVYGHHALFNKMRLSSPGA